MGNIIDYIQWRGDLGFCERSFCDADNLVFSYLAYYDFSGIVSDSEDSLTIREAEERYRELGQETIGTSALVLKVMAQSERFRNVRLSHYISKTDPQMQFAALRIELGDGTFYLAFRGTDDSIVGWKEDFSISYRVIPAQLEAVKYLKETMTREGCVYRIGGHSKGGNLAFYASMKAPLALQERILRVYNNDGPGISPERIDPGAYEQIRDKLTRIVPAYSIVGRLFEPDVEPLIVQSSGKGLMQHELLTWQIDGYGLSKAKAPETESLFYHQIFSKWIESADMRERETFVHDFFGALEESGAVGIAELREGGLDGFGTILLSIAESESRTQIVIAKLIHSFAERLAKCNFRNLLQNKKGLQGILLLLAGIICILAPQFAIQSLGMVAAGAFFLWSAKRLVDCGLDEDIPRSGKRKHLIVDIAFISAAVFLFTHYDVLLVSGSILFGILFMVSALYLIRRVWRSAVGRALKALTLVGGIVLFMLGLVSLVTPDASDWQKMISMGSVLVISGLGLILAEIFRESSQGKETEA